MRGCRNWNALRSKPGPRDGEIAMTSLQRRVRNLEAQVAVHKVVTPDWAIAMRESRRRRLAGVSHDVEWKRRYLLEDE
jgi:hypothetical protein